MQKVTVLLADDHAVVRAGILNALKELPRLEIVGEVGDGPSLLNTLAWQPVDLLLIDVTMPDFEPISAIQRIRNQYPKMKILVVSAYDDDVYVQGLLGAGVDGYHLKDQPLKDLRLAVERVLAGEKWVSSRLLSKLFTPDPPSARGLTARQRDILRLLLQGLDNQTIALQMRLSVKTVENHLTRLYRHLNVQSRLEAVNYALQHPQTLGLASHSAAQLAASMANPDPIDMMLVDDNPRYREQLRRMVGKAYPQARIYEADTIRQATEMAAQVRLRLVLVDVVLGDEDGILCTRQIKALLPASRIILISAYPDREFRRRGLAAGAAAFLDKKDLDVETLRQVIEDVIV